MLCSLQHSRKGELAVSTGGHTDEERSLGTVCDLPTRRVVAWPLASVVLDSRTSLLQMLPSQRGHAGVLWAQEAPPGWVPGRPAGLFHSTWRGDQREGVVTETSGGWLKGKALAEGKTS